MPDGTVPLRQNLNPLMPDAIPEQITAILDTLKALDHINCTWLS